MNTILSLLTDSALRPFPSERPFALLPLAGSTILGYGLYFLLDELAGLASAEAPLTLLVQVADQAAVADYVAAEMSEMVVRLLPIAAGVDTMSALLAHADLLDDGPLLLVDGLPIVDAAFAELISAETDFAFVVDEAEPVGVLWLKSGRRLAALLAEGVDGVSAVVDALAASGQSATPIAASLMFDIRDSASLLHANQHLLGQGTSAQTDIIERSYAEDFTVIAPVFVHPDAEIDNCVLGPYVSIGADAVLRDCIVRNSIIDAGCELTLAVLDGSLIGRDVVVSGRSRTLRAADGSSIDLSET